MTENANELIARLGTISKSEAGDHYAELTSFLVSLEDIVGIHSIKVADYAVITGREIELPDRMIESLYLSALLHDVGKLFIPPGILHKTGNLEQGELEIIRRHPSTGSDILQKIERYREYSGTVLYHHEFYNGRGYPEGLSATEIPLLSRIITVVDAYEAMTSDRPYRKGFSHREAVTRLRAGRTTQFDPEITDSFLKAIRKYSHSNI